MQIRLASSVLMAIILAAPAFSQFLLRVDQNGQSTTISNGGGLLFTSPAVGQAASAKLTLTYIGSTTAVFDTAPQVFGSGDFTVSSSGPVTLSPLQSTTLTFQFTPQRTTVSQSVSTWLYKEGDSKSYQVLSLSLSGTVPTLTVSSVSSDGNYVSVPVGGSLRFPDTLLSARSDVTVAVDNRGSGPASITSLGVSGDAYQLLGLPLLPVTLPAGGELRVTLRFLAKAAGVQAGSFNIMSDGGTYSAALQGNAVNSFFAFQFTGASGLQEPFSQPSIGLSLVTPYSTDLRGTLTLSTVTNIFAADPAVQFSSGGTKVDFTIPVGTVAAVFANGSAQILLQTGTVAELVMVTPSFSSASGTDLTPTSSKQLQIEIPRRAPTILEASVGSITSTGFSVNITGFSTTRSLDNLTFQFKGARGVSIPSTATTIDVSTSAAFWYASPTAEALGGLFSIDVPFTVSNGASGSALSARLAAYISAITISAANELGTSSVAQVAVP